MPKVGKMRFPYTEKGMKEAQNYSASSGKPMEIESYQYGGRVPRGRGMAPRPTRPGRGRGMNPGILQALMNRLKGRR